MLLVEGYSSLLQGDMPKRSMCIHFSTEPCTRHYFPGISGASYYEGTFANVARNNAGEYVAISSRGNFYMTWAPGQTYWMPHNRTSTRRLQNMGWTPDNKIWMSTRGGDLLFGTKPGITEELSDAKISSRGFGILDIG